MDFNAHGASRHEIPLRALWEVVHGWTSAKLLAVVALLLLSPVLTLASNNDSSAQIQADPHTDAGVEATAVITQVTLTASPSMAYVGDEITFFANATSDIPAANLTFTIFYDYFNLSGVNVYSAFTVNNTTNPGSVVTKHTYSTIGNYSDAQNNYFFWAIAYAFDGIDNLSSIPIQVFVNYNRAPWLRQPPPDPLITSANLNTPIVTYISDNDTDTVTVFWDFGDGTNITNVTVAPKYPGGIYVNQTHTWSPKIPGNPSYIIYLLNVTLSDGRNPPVKSTTRVNVSLPLNSPPELNILSPNTGSPLELLNFSANATDPEGDPLTWTFNYSDGTLHVFHTNWSTPGQLIWQNDTHAFASPGNYTVNISVSDALIPYQVSFHNISRSTGRIEVTVNVAPRVFPMILNPISPEINATIGYVDAFCSIDALDTDGDIMTLTWRLDGVVVGTNLSGGESDYVKYTHVVRFTDTGTFNISVTVTDGRPGHLVMSYKVVSVTSNNLPPAILFFKHDKYAEGDFATPNETLKFHLLATDPERDTLALVWDFGDGSPLIYLNLTEYVDGNVSVNLEHTYSQLGNYTIRIVLTDNKLGVLNHTLTLEAPVKVSVRPPKVVVEWDWWDYTSLGLLLMIPVGMVAWVLQLRSSRKKIENQGMTYDEYKLRRELKAEELKK